MFEKFLKAESPCPMDLLSRGGGQHAVSRESLVNSRKFNKEIFLARSAHNELSTNYSRLTTKTIGFTMAEILLSLTIIGVVAAITLPSLTGNINERTWNTQRKALFARMSQAVALMPTMNNYGSTTENRAETFIANGLSKVLKINNICGYGTDGTTLYDCGLSSQIIDGSGTKIDLPKTISDLNAGIITPVSGTTITIPNNKAVAFETANGESILTFYNASCTASNVFQPTTSSVLGNGQLVKQHVCANFVYDLNGKKGPNTVGKDIGVMTVIYSSDSKVVMPINPRDMSSKKHVLASQDCNALDEGQYRLPNIEEVLSIYYNKSLFGANVMSTNTGYWSSTASDAQHYWGFGYTYGAKYAIDKEESERFLCVQR